MASGEGESKGGAAAATAVAVAAAGGGAEAAAAGAEAEAGAQEGERKEGADASPTAGAGRGRGDAGKMSAEEQVKEQRRRRRRNVDLFAEKGKRAGAGARARARQEGDGGAAAKLGGDEKAAEEDVMRMLEESSPSAAKAASVAAAGQTRKRAGAGGSGGGGSASIAKAAAAGRARGAAQKTANGDDGEEEGKESGDALVMAHIEMNTGPAANRSQKDDDADAAASAAAAAAAAAEEEAGRKADGVSVAFTKRTAGTSRNTRRKRMLALEFRRDSGAAVVYLQRWARTVRISGRFMELRKHTVALQRWFRGRAARRRFVNTVHSIILLQRVARGMLARQRCDDLQTGQQLDTQAAALHFAHERERMFLTLVIQKIAQGVECKILPIAVDLRLEQEQVYSKPWCEIFMNFAEQASTQQGTSLKCVGVGQTFTVFLTELGEIWTAGWGDMGQLGHRAVTQLHTPRKIEFHSFKDSVRSPNKMYAGVKPMIYINKIAVGANHTVALDARGQVFTFGSNTMGQLGYRTGPVNSPNATAFSFNPQGVPLSTTVYEIACGDAHTAVILTGGAIMYWGLGMWAGLRSRAAATAGTTSSGASSSSTVASGAGTATAAAGGHSSNSSSSSSGHNRKQIPPAVLQELAAEPFAVHPANMVASAHLLFCGKDFTVAVDTERSVYTWGRNREGQLGLGIGRPKYDGTAHTSDDTPLAVHRPTRVGSTWVNPGQFQIQKISVGSSHTIVVGTNNRVYVWGSNAHGQLGLGKDVEHRWDPTCLNALNDLEPLSVAAGARHSLVVTKSRGVLAFGRVGCVQLSLSYTPSFYRESGSSNIMHVNKPMTMPMADRFAHELYTVKCINSRGLSISVLERRAITGDATAQGSGRRGRVNVYSPRVDMEHVGQNPFELSMRGDMTPRGVSPRSSQPSSPRASRPGSARPLSVRMDNTDAIDFDSSTSGTPRGGGGLGSLRPAPISTGVDSSGRTAETTNTLNAAVTQIRSAAGVATLAAERHLRNAKQPTNWVQNTRKAHEEKPLTFMDSRQIDEIIRMGGVEALEKRPASATFIQANGPNASRLRAQSARPGMFGGTMQPAADDDAFVLSGTAGATQRTRRQQEAEREEVISSIKGLLEGTSSQGGLSKGPTQRHNGPGSRSNRGSTTNARAATASAASGAGGLAKRGSYTRQRGSVHGTQHEPWAQHSEKPQSPMADVLHAHKRSPSSPTSKTSVLGSFNSGGGAGAAGTSASGATHGKALSLSGLMHNFSHRPAGSGQDEMGPVTPAGTVMSTPGGQANQWSMPKTPSGMSEVGGDGRSMSGRRSRRTSLTSAAQRRTSMNRGPRQGMSLISAIATSETVQAMQQQEREAAAAATAVAASSTEQADADAEGRHRGSVGGAECEQDRASESSAPGSSNGGHRSGQRGSISGNRIAGRNRNESIVVREEAVLEHMLNSSADWGTGSEANSPRNTVMGAGQAASSARPYTNLNGEDSDSDEEDAVPPPPPPPGQPVGSIDVDAVAAEHAPTGAVTGGGQRRTSRPGSAASSVSRGGRAARGSFSNPSGLPRPGVGVGAGTGRKGRKGGAGSLSQRMKSTSQRRSRGGARGAGGGAGGISLSAMINMSSGGVGRTGGSVGGDAMTAAALHVTQQRQQQQQQQQQWQQPQQQDPNTASRPVAQVSPMNNLTVTGGSGRAGGSPGGPGNHAFGFGASATGTSAAVAGPDGMPQSPLTKLGFGQTGGSPSAGSPMAGGDRAQSQSPALSHSSAAGQQPARGRAKQLVAASGSSAPSGRTTRRRGGGGPGGASAGNGARYGR